MRQVDSPIALILERFDAARKNVLDVGCGTGDAARALAARGARVIAIDRPEMLLKARSTRGCGETFVAGAGEALPINDGCVDAVLFIASLHHIPAESVDDALCECARVLVPSGHAFVVEPVQSEGSWGDITRLMEDEVEVQKRAYEAIVRAATLHFTMVDEERFFIARSFVDVERLTDTFVDDPTDRLDILTRARAMTIQRAREAGIAFDDYRYRSWCRLNVLRRVGFVGVRSSVCSFGQAKTAD